MTITGPTYGTIQEDAGAALMARVVGADASALEQADVTAISYKVFDLNASDPGATATTGTCTIASVMFDTLQTDARWTVDLTGYNFRHEMPAAAFSTGGHRYRVEYRFDPVTGEDFTVLFELYAEPISGS